MEQRPLRVGDLVDDYCPRERRLTNHAVVAIVGDTIRQTRCTTCDADHPYKEGRTPRPRKKDAPVTAPPNGAGLAARPEPPASMEVPEPEPAPMVASAAASASENGRANHAPHTPEPENNGQRDEFWPAHRTLIRATLPRTDNNPPTPRPIPEFTMHQRNVRGHHQFRPQGQGGWPDRGNGNPPRGGGGGRPHRFAGSGGQGTGNGSGQGQGQGQGQGPGPGGPGPGGGRPGGGRHRKSRRPR